MPGDHAQSQPIRDHSSSRIREAVFDDPAMLRSLYAPPAEIQSEPEAAFPLGFYEELLCEINRRGIQTLTYEDIFKESDDWDHTTQFAKEHSRWLARRDPRTISLIIQHDVDNHPFFTERMLAMEAVYGVRSNVFIFRDRFRQDRDDVPYDVDHGFLKQAERNGWVIGYHQNAFALAGFDMNRAIERFENDVAWLRTMYRIQFMVPHGGAGREIDGTMVRNIDVPIPPSLRRSLRWVYNRYRVKVNASWSDGGLRKNRDLQRIRAYDILKFVRELKPGTRNFCLVHPQRWGYNVNMNQNPLLANEQWYIDMCARHGVLPSAENDAMSLVPNGEDE
ncbi:MAG TPA: hypothetical protein VG711_12055 [Phycisphaerales bacterium]|nr:hypothetical protein [Phycisphaerales bacterium]